MVAVHKNIVQVLLGFYFVLGADSLDNLRYDHAHSLYRQNKDLTQNIEEACREKRHNEDNVLFQKRHRHEDPHAILRKTDPRLAVDAIHLYVRAEKACHRLWKEAEYSRQ